MPKPLQTFIIYARKDLKTLEGLKAHLKSLEHENKVSLWYDGEIVPGQKWDIAVKEQLAAAKIILMLISIDFINSSYIEKVELQKALEQHKAGTSVIIPILARSCKWEQYFNIGELQALPSNGKPIQSKHWKHERDEAFTNVVDGIEKVISTLQVDPPSNVKEPPIAAPPSNNSHSSQTAWELVQSLKDNQGHEKALNFFLKKHKNSPFYKEAKKELETIKVSRKEKEAAWENTLVAKDMIKVQGGIYKREGFSVQVDDFLIKKYPVTFEEYDAYCEATGLEKLNDHGWGRGSHPVINISWYDAIAYCNWLSEQYHLEPTYEIDKKVKNVNNRDKLKWTVVPIAGAKGFRLPTEAEWEYAARGGQQSKGYTYSGSNKLDEVAWYGENANGKTHPVGTKKPNELGIYDMSGNVWEWCWDWYAEDYYKNSPTKNPLGPKNGQDIVLRGGSWLSIGYVCRVSLRYWLNPYDRDILNGVRLVEGC